MAFLEALEGKLTENFTPLHLSLEDKVTREQVKKRATKGEVFCEAEDVEEVEEEEEERREVE